VAAGPHSPATKQSYYFADFVRDGAGNGFWALGGNIFGPERIWHNSGGAWSAPASVPWAPYQLAAVPHTRSTWGIGWNASQTKGVIVLHGLLPASRAALDPSATDPGALRPSLPEVPNPGRDA